MFGFLDIEQNVDFLVSARQWTLHLVVSSQPDHIAEMPICDMLYYPITAQRGTQRPSNMWQYTCIAISRDKSQLFEFIRRDESIWEWLRRLGPR